MDWIFYLFTNKNWVDYWAEKYKSEYDKKLTIQTNPSFACFMIDKYGIYIVIALASLIYYLFKKKRHK